MGMVDLLLGAGDALAERPEADFEVGRLSKAFGQPFLVHAKALTMKEIDECSSRSDYREHIILAAVTDPDFKDKRLAEKLQPKDRKTPLTPIEVLHQLLQPGEIVNLYAGISELCGFGTDAVEKIEKN